MTHRFRLVRHSGRSGFTLIETIFAVLIVGAAAMAMVSAAIFTERQAQVNRDHMYGLMIANSVAAEVMAADWEQLGNPTLPAAQTQLERDLIGPITRFGDRFIFDITPQYTITLTYTGWGTVQSATANTLTVGTLPGRRAWVPNEFAGQYVQIYQGTGLNTMMRIRSNTADTLTVSANLTAAGATGPLQPWPIIPDTTSRFAINQGKLVEINVNWDRGNSRTGAQFRNITRSVFVPRRVINNF